MDYYKFLSGIEKDDKGRMVEDILKYSPLQLEFKHNYIQEVFPTMGQSQFSKIRPITEEEVEAIRQNETAKQNIHRMYGIMLDFWKINGNDYKKFGSILPIRFWNVWDNHNHLRMTRVLKSLKLLGMEEEYNDFSMRIKYMISLSRMHKGVHITRKTLRIWEQNAD